MRPIPLLALSLLAALAGGCAHVNEFRPARADQAAPDEPGSAYVEAGGVRAWVRAGDWRGWPDDLEARVTPVEVFLENQGPDALAIRPELFTLRTPGGFRAQALEPDQVQRMVASAWRREAVYFHSGFYGFYPWPAWPVRHHRVYPYAWWGWYPPPMVVVTEPAPAAPPGPPPVGQGTLERGGHVSVLLLFPIPAERLERFQLSVALRTPAGEDGGALEVELARAAR